MKWYIPREHGAWAMLIVPYWIGATISGLELSHVLFFIGLFSIYFAQAPLLTFVRNPKITDVWASFFCYIGIGSVFITPFLIYNPSLLLIGFCIFPLFLTNVYFAKTKRERWFVNDLIAIIALSSLLLLAYRLNEPALTSEAFLLVFINVLFFSASVFHVKSLIREKNSRPFYRASISYHIFIVVLAFSMQWLGVGLAFFITLLKTVFIREKYLKRPIQIGIIEIITSGMFFAIVTGAYFWL